MYQGYAKVRLGVALGAAEPRSFRIFRATPRRTAAQNAARFIARIGERVIGFRRVTYDGRPMVAVNFFGANPAPRVKLARAKRFTVASDGSRWPM